MGDRLQTASLRFKDTAVYGKTKSVKQATHETRNIGGKSVKAVINKGPGVTEYQKAAGHEVKPVAVQEAHSRTPVPDPVTHRVTTTRQPAGAQPGRTEEPNKGKEEKREP